MTYHSRYLTSQVIQDLQRKMVFVGGPRQVGKTTLAKHLSTPKAYLNWDIAEHRETILKRQLPNKPLWVFDELHKYAKWRNYLKGLYDAHGHPRQFLVTGSARLDYYRRGGDSLQGRYHYLRLHPLSVAELAINTLSDFKTLFTLGGFPEPLLLGSAIEAKRWSREYRERLVQEDLISLEHVKDLGSLELLMLRLPSLVGSPLSVNALREDLQVSHKTVSRWLTIFERLYAIFFVLPFGSPHIRAVKKERKHYHYDWTLPDKEACRFENMVAAHLLKWVHYQQDTQAKDIELRYFRDIDGREVDFIVVEKGQPIQAIECKLNNTDISKHLRYFKQRFPHCNAWQISARGNKDYVSSDNIRVCQGLHYLKTLV